MSFCLVFVISVLMLCPAKSLSSDSLLQNLKKQSYWFHLHLKCKRVFCKRLLSMCTRLLEALIKKGLFTEELDFLELVLIKISVIKCHETELYTSVN